MRSLSSSARRRNMALAARIPGHLGCMAVKMLAAELETERGTRQLDHFVVNVAHRIYFAPAAAAEGIVMQTVLQHRRTGQRIAAAHQLAFLDVLGSV